jgi:rhamnosyltransferase
MTYSKDDSTRAVWRDVRLLTAACPIFGGPGTRCRNSVTLGPSAIDSPVCGARLLDTSMLSQARIIIPVRNGGLRWREAAAALHRSVPDAGMVVVIDSSSTDGSDAVAAEHGFQLHRIDVRTFNHGRTRQEAVDKFSADRSLVVFLTQDAVVESRETLVTVLSAFADARVGAAYGRQLPHHDAKPFEAHAALFNYPPHGETRWLADGPRLGAKITYLSNSFAAYRIAALKECGGFPSHLILAEDACVAMRMLLSGWGIRYCADALVRHSHSYTIVDEMQRYFDIGVMHAQLPQILQAFGALEGEGARFVASELVHISRTAPWLLPQAAVRNTAKYVSYRLGRAFRHLPSRWCRRLSMTKGYWDRTAQTERSDFERVPIGGSEDGASNQAETQQRPKGLGGVDDRFAHSDE